MKLLLFVKEDKHCFVVSLSLSLLVPFAAVPFSLCLSFSRLCPSLYSVVFLCGHAFHHPLLILSFPLLYHPIFKANFEKQREKKKKHRACDEEYLLLLHRLV